MPTPEERIATALEGLVMLLERQWGMRVATLREEEAAASRKKECMDSMVRDGWIDPRDGKPAAPAVVNDSIPF